MAFQDTIDAYFHHMNERDRHAWLATFSDQPGLTHIDPVDTPARHTREEIGGFWDQIMSAFQELSLEVDRVYPRAGQVACAWKAKGRGRNGAQVEFDGINVFVADGNDKILSLTAYWDSEPALGPLTT